MSNDRLAKYYGWFAFGIWGLIALGGSVRAMNAGLACPDWPLCFGNVIPDYHPQVYFEFIHRVVAGVMGIAGLTLAIIVFRRPNSSRQLKVLAASSLALYLAQAVMGGLTVLLQLQEKVVVGHLLLGTSWFALNLWTHLSLRKKTEEPSLPVGLGRGARFVSVVIFGQILLGGLVASHYAALVCTDFPTCQGKWIPTFSGIIGLHVLHRFGAYFTALTIWGFFAWSRMSAPKEAVVFRKTTHWMAGVVLVQVMIGIANVLFYTPPLITVLHLATGVALFGLSLRAVFSAPYFLASSSVRSSARLATN